VIPKVLYGLEIASLNATQSQLLDRQLRSALKSLMGFSKHSTNELLKYFNLTTVANLLKQRKINLLVNQLLKNPMTSSYLFSILSQKNRSYSVIQDLLDTYVNQRVSTLSTIWPKKHTMITVTESSLDLETRTKIKNLLENWTVIENRQELKTMLTRYI